MSYEGIGLETADRLRRPERRRRHKYRITERRRLIRGDMVILILSMSCFGMGASRFIQDATIYDQTPPVSNLVQVPTTESVRPGEAFIYVARYDKRADCKFTSGAYSMTGYTAAGERYSLLDFSTPASGTWESGTNKTVRAGVGIPSIVPPGIYSLWWRYCWTCAGARGELCVPSSDPIETAMTVRVQ